MFRLQPMRRALPGILLSLCLLLAAVAIPPPTRADIAATPIPPGALPVTDLKPVELSFITIDATLTPTGDGIALEVRSRTRLHNPDKRATFERQVTFGAPAVSDVRLGTQNGGMQAASGGAPWTLSLRPQGDAIIEGTQRLAAGGPIIDLLFDWEALRAWGATPDSLRLTLHLPQDAQSSQLLVVSPAPTARDTMTLTWSYENKLPAGQVHVRLIAPSYWRALVAARDRTAAQGAGAGDYLALATALGPLAGAEGMPANRAATYQAELLAALRGAVAAGAQDVQAHRELASYLEPRAGDDAGLLAEAVAEYKAAYDLAPNDADLRARLLAALARLVAACRQAGDTDGALAALSLAASVDGRPRPELAAAYADRAVALLQAGRQSEAEAAIVAGFGQAALDRYAFYRPHFLALTGEVETSLNARHLRFALLPAPGLAEAAQRDVAAALAALSRVEGCRVQSTAGEGQITVGIDIAYASAEDLRAAGQALAGSLPADADPALVLLGAVVGPGAVELETVNARGTDRLSYSEAANLTPAQQALARRLEQIKYARAEVEARSDDPTEAARRRWAQALLGRYEADWQTLARGTRVSYRLRLPEDIVAPQWNLAWNEQRPLSWSVTIPRPERLQPYVIGVGAALLGVFAVVFVVNRIARRRAGS